MKALTNPFQHFNSDLLSQWKKEYFKQMLSKYHVKIWVDFYLQIRQKAGALTFWDDFVCDS